MPIQNFVDDSIHWAIPGDSLSIAEALLKSFDQKKDSVNISKNKSLIKEIYNWDNEKKDTYPYLTQNENFIYIPRKYCWHINLMEK